MEPPLPGAEHISGHRDDDLNKEVFRTPKATPQAAAADAGAPGGAPVTSRLCDRFSTSVNVPCIL